MAFVQHQVHPLHPQLRESLSTLAATCSELKVGSDTTRAVPKPSATVLPNGSRPAWASMTIQGVLSGVQESDQGAEHGVLRAQAAGGGLHDPAHDQQVQVSFIPYAEALRHVRYVGVQADDPAPPPSGAGPHLLFDIVELLGYRSQHPTLLGGYPSEYAKFC